MLAMHAICEQRSWEGLELNPRTCASARAHHCKHLRWFALPADTARNAFLRWPLFRLSQVRPCSPVSDQVSQAPHCGWAAPAALVPRAVRLCLQCDMGALGDENRVLFECSATRAARAPYAHLFPLGCIMLELMHHTDTVHWLDAYLIINSQTGNH